LEEVRVQDEVDCRMGFERFESTRAGGEEKIGWLVNMHQVSQGPANLRQKLQDVIGRGRGVEEQDAKERS
jgi:uncharacterized protein YfcZ (UPF0381/DUF406 family)